LSASECAGPDQHGQHGNQKDKATSKLTGH
jgi:hypothetical protein